MELISFDSYMWIEGRRFLSRIFNETNQLINGASVVSVKYIDFYLNFFQILLNVHGEKVCYSSLNINSI